MATQKQSRTETMRVEGSSLIDRFKQLVHEGNVRRIVIKQEGRTLVEFPLTVGVVGAVLAPMLAAVGAVAALVTDCTIEVEREEEAPSATEAAAGMEPPMGTEPREGA